MQNIWRRVRREIDIEWCNHAFESVFNVSIERLCCPAFLTTMTRQIPVEAIVGRVPHNPTAAWIESRLSIEETKTCKSYLRMSCSCWTLDSRPSSPFGKDHHAHAARSSLI